MSSCIRIMSIRKRTGTHKTQQLLHLRVFWKERFLRKSALAWPEKGVRRFCTREATSEAEIGFCVCMYVCMYVCVRVCYMRKECADLYACCHFECM
jgi:hypothetical protein